MLAFLDLETTGLDANDCEVLEVACIITDDTFSEISRFQSVVWTQTEFYQLDEFIRDMHTKNGLWADVKAASQRDESEPRPQYGIQPYYYAIENIDERLAAFIRDTAVRVVTTDKGPLVERPQLAGNTISFDRAFMKRHLPNAEAELHYRNVDISSLNEMARRFNKPLYDARPRNAVIAHRAMADCEESLKVAKHYADAMVAMLIPVKS